MSQFQPFSTNSHPESPLPKACATSSNSSRESRSQLSLAELIRGPSSPKPHVVVLGGGPAGLGAAFQLTKSETANVTLLERNDWLGGNSASFELAGMHVDFGSHRLHPVCDPDVLDDIRELLQDDLLDRPRHGRIRMRERWIHFPLKPLDLAFKLPPSFALGVARDALTKAARSGKQKSNDASDETSFAEVLNAGFGGTICRDFYFPYARKIWGIAPNMLSGIQAHRRVSAGSLSRMLRKIATAIPGLRPSGAGRFLYPKQGYGQICNAYGRAVQQRGATIKLGATVTSVDTTPGQPKSVRFIANGEPQCIEADYIWSTIPITVLAPALKPCPPAELIRAAQKIDFRAMILIYLVLDQDQFTEYDAHYFPESSIRISRLSEPKNYSNGNGPSGRTVLCAELPCSPDDPEWSANNECLADLVCETMASVGQPIQTTIREIETRRIRNAYPIYRLGYNTHFNRLDQWMKNIDGLLTFGRQGLFSHDNLHHALYMGYSAANCLSREGNFDQHRWRAYRSEFEHHVVED